MDDKIFSHIDDNNWRIYSRESPETPICVLTPLDLSHPDCKPILDRFVNVSNEAIQIDRIWSCNNPLQKERYEARKARMQFYKSFCGDGDETVEELLFHTTSGPLMSVMAQSLKETKARIGLLGRALYFTDDFYKTSSYWPHRFNSRGFLCARVLTGRKFFLQDNFVCKALQAPPATYNSVQACLRGINEVAVYNEDQVDICFYVQYSVKPKYAPEALAHLAGNYRGEIRSVPSSKIEQYQRVTF